MPYSLPIIQCRGYRERQREKASREKRGEREGGEEERERGREREGREREGERSRERSCCQTQIRLKWGI